MISDRTQEILEYLNIHGRATVKELCRIFDVSDMTIRRSLQVLESKNQVIRFHGGAILKQNEDSSDEFEQRMALNAPLKATLAQGCRQYALEQIKKQNLTSIYIASGSTMLNFARVLTLPDTVTAITDNVYVSQALLHNKVKNIITVGGQLLMPSANAVGFLAEQMIAGFTPDLAFVGAPAVDRNGVVYVYNMMEANVYKTLIQKAYRTVLVLDHTKFDQRNLVQLYDLDDRFTVITTEGVPEEVVNLLTERGTEVRIV